MKLSLRSKLSRKSKQLLSLLLSSALFFVPLQPLSAARPPQSSPVTVQSGEYSTLTVTTPNQFIHALEQGISNILVNGSITLGDQAEASGRMIPITIPEGTTIEGTQGSCIYFRCPLQLGGDDITFRNIELLFVSSDALGSIPHREIFLAGHSLTLDNVSTFLKGSGGSLGLLGGSEEELLPSIYAGAYPNTPIGSNAALTIKNSNSKTMFQNIYMGHEESIYQDIPYTEDAVLELDNPVTVRGGIYTDKNRSAEIILTGDGKSILCHAKSTNFIGNDATTLTISQCSVSRAIVDGIGTILLDNHSYFMPQSKQLNNISLQNQSCLDLCEAVNVTVTGDFAGGYYDFDSDFDEESISADQNTNGILVLEKEGTLTIEGTVTGTTCFQTENKNFPGIPAIGKKYIIADQTDPDTPNFILPDAYREDYELQYQAGAWMLFNSYFNENYYVPEIASVEIISAPLAIDLAQLEENPIDEEDVTSITDESIYFTIQWKDTDGNIISDSAVKGYFFDYQYMMLVKTAYWEDSTDSSNQATDWGNNFMFSSFEEYPNRYYLFPPDNPKTGEYTFLFFSINIFHELYEKNKEENKDPTVEDIKAFKEYVKAELQVTFYDSSKTDENSSLLNEKASVRPISDQIYTGKAICPEVQVTDSSGTALIKGQDYLLSYENNIQVGEASVKIIGTGNYSGEIIQTFFIRKSESEVLLTAAMSSNQEADSDPILATYGDKIRFICKAAPAQTKMARTARAAIHTVDFYCGEVLLGTAPVNAEGQAVFIYNTTDQKIPIGDSVIYADFGGTAALSPAESSTTVSITLKKQILSSEKIESIALKDFTYDGTTKTTEILSLTLEDNRTLSVSGTAELADTQSGVYKEANVLSWSLKEEEQIWYQLPEISSPLKVEPNVTIIPAIAPTQITLHFAAAPNTEQNISIQTVIPMALQSEITNYQLGKEQFNSSLLGSPSITDGILTYHANQLGTEIIPVLISLKNYKPMTVLVSVTVTDKTSVALGLTSPDSIYNGKPYDKWSTQFQTDAPFQVTYYDLTEQQSLKEAPTNAGNYSITIHMENDNEIGEQTSTFRILPKEIRIHPINRTIQIGDPIPDLSNPQLTMDYEYESGYTPIAEESPGTIKMLYSETPDNTKEGSYKIFIKVLEENQTNYQIKEDQGTLSILAPEQEHKHTYKETITAEPTCTEKGIITYTCSICGDFYKEEIPAANHNIVIDSAIEATCTSQGKTEGAHCSICHTILLEQALIPAKAHSYGDWNIDLAPTTEEEGSKYRICTICNRKETSTIPKLDENKEDNNNSENNNQNNNSTEDNNNDNKNPSDNNNTNEGNKKPEDNTPEDNKNNNDNTSEDNNSTSDNNTNEVAANNSTTTTTEKIPSIPNQTDYIDPIKGHISLTKGILTGSGNDYAEWKQSNGSWWLKYADGTWPSGHLTENGQQIYQWEMINGEWYAFDVNGYTRNGWHMDAGYQGWFYIDINYGMKTGWQLIEGKWYYLNPISNGTKGKMYANCYTPDGWYVDKNGVWDGNPQLFHK